MKGATDVLNIHKLYNLFFLIGLLFSFYPQKLLAGNGETSSLSPFYLLGQVESIPVLNSYQPRLALSQNPQGVEDLPKPTCLEKGGRVVISTWKTSLLPLPVDYRLYLPPCYQEFTHQRYPLLILIHGQSYTDDQWVRMGVDDVADGLIRSGKVPPFMILMPRDRYGGQPTENNFAKVVVEELLPSIDDQYRTIADRDSRAVGGLSRGAGWAVHMGLYYWQEFSLIGAHSPAIFYTDAQQMRTWFDSIPENQLPTVFVDIGERDFSQILDSAYWFSMLLNEKDIPHEWYLFAGFHNEAYWSSHLEQYLRWYAQNW